MPKLGISPFNDGKLRCANCGRRFAAHLMIVMRRPSPKWNKVQYRCPKCDDKAWELRTARLPKQQAQAQNPSEIPALRTRAQG